jgi:hypothetical protein
MPQYPLTRNIMDTDIRVKSDCPYGKPRFTKLGKIAENKAPGEHYSVPLIIFTSSTKTVVEFLRVATK